MPTFKLLCRTTTGVQEAHLRQTNSLLESMEKAGLNWLNVGCRRGGCGECKCKITNGKYLSKKMSRAHISLEEEQCGFVLACRIQPENYIEIELVK